jgi:hypothetical protein
MHFPVINLTKTVADHLIKHLILIKYLPSFFYLMTWFEPHPINIVNFLLIYPSQIVNIHKVLFFAYNFLFLQAFTLTIH